MQISKDGGYATSSTYVSNLCSIIERWNLTKYDATVSTAPADSCPFLVRVSINDLNIRKGAGTNYARTGKYTGKGVFTIVEVKSGTGSAKGWGRLKSGAGRIALDYAARIYFHSRISRLPVVEARSSAAGFFCVYGGCSFSQGNRGIDKFPRNGGRDYASNKDYFP